MSQHDSWPHGHPAGCGAWAVFAIALAIMVGVLVALSGCASAPRTVNNATAQDWADIAAALPPAQRGK